MHSFLFLLLAIAPSVAPQPASSPPSVVDLYLTPISTEQLQRFARILVELGSARASSGGAAVSEIPAAQRDAIVRRNGMSVEMFGRIAAQVRYDRNMARRVAENINILRSTSPGA
jgi:hypothetical protein